MEQKQQEHYKRLPVHTRNKKLQDDSYLNREKT